MVSPIVTSDLQRGTGVTEHNFVDTHVCKTCCIALLMAAALGCEPALPRYKRAFWLLNRSDCGSSGKECVAIPPIVVSTHIAAHCDLAIIFVLSQGCLSDLKCPGSVRSTFVCKARINTNNAVWCRATSHVGLRYSWIYWRSIVRGRPRCKQGLLHDTLIPQLFDYGGTDLLFCRI